MAKRRKLFGKLYVLPPDNTNRQTPLVAAIWDKLAKFGKIEVVAYRKTDKKWYALIDNKVLSVNASVELFISEADQEVACELRTTVASQRQSANKA